MTPAKPMPVDHLDGTDPDAWVEDRRPRWRLHDLPERAVSVQPDSDAVVDEDGRLSYRGLARKVETLAHALRAGGVTRGSRVATLVSAGNQGTALLYAVSKIGAVSVPINELHAPPEIADVLRRSGACHCVVDTRLGSTGAVGAAAYALLSPADRPGYALMGEDGDLSWESVSTVGPRAPDPDEIALVLFTSGSTARPKGVLVTHEGLVGAAHYAALAMCLTAQDRLLDIMPSYHVAGIVDGILALHRVGGTCVTARFSPERFLELCEQERITATMGFGPMIEAVLNDPGYSPSRHRDLRTVALSQVSERLMTTLRDAGVEHVAYGFGMTEASSDFLFSRPWLPDEEAIESVGLPLPGLDVRIVDPVDERVLGPGDIGEIRVKGWSVCRGYIDGSNALDASGYWKSGDLGCFRPSGTVQFRGRIKFMVKSGGENVSAYEVEEFLKTTVPEVKEAVVVGVPDERWGEKVVAFVMFAEGHSLTSDQLKARCRDRIAGYKIPKNFLPIVATEWPLTSVGKLDRPRLTALAVSRLQAGS
jgi:acyl-CoA synthetase (AMP-forming)/AMP-acid ligase II